MPRAGESPALYPTKELRADGKRVAGADELRTCAKDPGGREQHAVQHGAGSSNGVETGRRTGDEQHPTRAGNSLGRRGSEEGGPPTPSAAANLLCDLQAQLVELHERAEAVVARVEALESGRGLVSECDLACPAGLDTVTLKPNGDVACRCVRITLDVVSLSSLNAKAARLQAADGPSQHVHQEPGAAVEDTRAGLSSSRAEASL